MATAPAWTSLTSIMLATALPTRMRPVLLHLCKDGHEQASLCYSSYSTFSPGWYFHNVFAVREFTEECTYDVCASLGMNTSRVSLKLQWGHFLTVQKNKAEKLDSIVQWRLWEMEVETTSEEGSVRTHWTENGLPLSLPQGHPGRCTDGLYLNIGRSECSVGDK